MRKLAFGLSLFAAFCLSGCGYNSMQTQDEQVKSAWSSCSELKALCKAAGTSPVCSRAVSTWRRWISKFCSGISCIESPSGLYFPSLKSASPPRAHHSGLFFWRW